jgi:hypothetical protein
MISRASLHLSYKKQDEKAGYRYQPTINSAINQSMSEKG